MDSFDWFERFFLIIHEANPEVAGIAQCVQCKAKTMLWFITWKEAFRQRKNKNGNVTNNQRHLFPISRQLTNTTGLLPRNHEENDRLWKVLAYSDLLTIDSHTEADQEEHDVITITEVDDCIYEDDEKALENINASHMEKSFTCMVALLTRFNL